MTNLSPTLAVINGVPRASSLDIAAHFGKRHVDVRAINKAIVQVPEDFAQRNFAFSDYHDSTGRSFPKCDLSHDGFSFVVMGFTGKKAAQWKVVYITAFRAMAETLNREKAHALPAPREALPPRRGRPRKQVDIFARAGKIPMNLAMIETMAKCIQSAKKDIAQIMAEMAEYARLNPPRPEGDEHSA